MNTATHDSELSSMVAQQAERLFSGLVTKQVMTSADAGEWQGELWRQVVEAGLHLALVPESDGGVGLPAADAFALVRRAAYHSLPLPLAETMLARALWSAALGAVEDRFADAPWTLPLGADTPVSLTRHADGWLMRGTVTCVPWADESGVVLLHAREEGGDHHLVLLPAKGLASNTRLTLANEPRSDLRIEDVVVASQAVRPAPGCIAAHGLRHYAATIRSQQMAGAMQRALDHALVHARDRVQFGKAIASMPAVQGLLVQSAAQSAAAGVAADLAASRFDASLQAGGEMNFAFETRGGACFAPAAAMAKSRAGEAAGQVAACCHQVHGAMGFTHEHPLHFSTRRLWAWRDEAGSESHWQEAIGRLVCGAGGEALWPMLTNL